MDLWIRPEGWLRWFAHPLALCAGIAPSTSEVAGGFLSFLYTAIHNLPQVRIVVVAVQPLSCSNSATPWTATHQASLSFTVFWSLLKRMSTELVMLSNHLILCCPLLLMPSIFSSTRVFCNELALRTMWPKYCNFNFSINPSNEYSGWISFRTDWFGPLADQGTFKSLLQHYSLKTSIL